MHLREILLNEDKGAAELLRSTLKWLEQHPDTLDEVQLENTLKILRTTRPAMVGFRVLADRIEHDLFAFPQESLAEIVRQLFHRFNQAKTQMVRNARDRLQEKEYHTVVTLSRSSAVLGVLEALTRDRVSVHVLESNPGGEGRFTYEQLRHAGIEAALYQDYDMEQAVQTADAGLIGADILFPDGCVYNKVLSRKLGETLRDNGKSLYVVASTWKRADYPADKHRVPGKDRYLFEMVPAAVITEIITE